jgi:hypothetical protein
MDTLMNPSSHNEPVGRGIGLTTRVSAALRQNA